MEAQKDEILEEVWRIKASLADEAGGDMDKLIEIINKKADQIKADHGFRTVPSSAHESMALNEEQGKYNSH